MASLVVEALLVVTFAASGANAPVEVYTDNNPRHWNEWTVISTSGNHIDRENRCRFRVDASRVLRFGPRAHLAKGMPHKCESRWSRKHLRPDPAPR